jgi:hypothetical protein
LHLGIGFVQRKQNSFSYILKFFLHIHILIDFFFLNLNI